MDISVQFFLNAFFVLGVLRTVTAVCTQNDILACSQNMTQIQSSADLNLVCKFSTDARNCLMDLQLACDDDVKNLIELGLSHLNRVLDNCPSSGGSDCNIMKCIHLITGMSQSSSSFEENCKFARQASDCLMEQKVKCAGNQQATAQIESGLPGFQQQLAYCPSKDTGKCDLVKFTSCTNNSQALDLGHSEDKVKNVENCKSLIMAVECMQDFVGSCDVPGIHAMVNQTLSNMTPYQAACKTLIENEKKQKQEKEKQSNDQQASVSADRGGNGVKQTTQSPVLIVTSGIALLLRAKFNN